MASSSLPKERPRIPEDTVCYWLYAEKEIEVADILSAVAKIAHDYIWNEETFSLSVKGESVMSHFRGSTHYGANVEDEWFIVHILLELTRLFSGLVVRVLDDDGEFLLIEAADVLPDWLDADTSENRVFLMNGKVHLIPDDPSFPRKIDSPKEGVALVRRSSEATVSHPISAAVRARCNQSRPQTNGLSHRAQCLLPSTLALLCKDRPDLLAAAVVAVFNGREAHDSKLCREMRCTEGDLVRCSIVFTRPHFAMLSKRTLVPDGRSDWPLPKPDQDGYQSSLLGFKISCGFELLKHKATLNGTSSHPIDRPLVDKVAEEVAGDVCLLVEPKRRRMRDLVERMLAGDQRAMVAHQLQTALSEQCDADRAEMHRLSHSLPPNDDASWLNVQEKDLSNGFDAAFTKEAADMFSDILSPNPPTSRPKKLARDVSNFLTEGSGPVEGAEFTKNGPKKSNRITFDADMFGDSLKKILSLEGAHDKEPYASPSDSDVSYGDEDLQIDLNEAAMKAAAATEVKTSLRGYMQQMDRELATTNVAAGFERRSPGGDSIDDADEGDFRPVDIDKNLVGNLLRSYWSEAGSNSRGPASTLLHGVRLADEEQLDSDDEECD